MSSLPLYDIATELRPVGSPKTAKSGLAPSLSKPFIPSLALSSSVTAANTSPQPVSASFRAAWSNAASEVFASTAPLP